LSSEILKNINFRNTNFKFAKYILPVSWKKSIIIYKRLIANLNSPPELVLLLGIHSQKKISFERYAWNFKIGKDIDKNIKFGLIRMHFSPWIKTSLSLNKIYSNLKDKKKISISYFPGFYLCNYLYFWALHISRKQYPVIFIHFPDKGNVNDYVKSLEDILKTIMKAHFKKNLNI
jgi:pyrrolidone-carboxylate peptidase